MESKAKSRFGRQTRPMLMVSSQEFKLITTTTTTTRADKK
jgi:hypothetical protein